MSLTVLKILKIIAILIPKKAKLILFSSKHLLLNSFAYLKQSMDNKARMFALSETS